MGRAMLPFRPLIFAPLLLIYTAFWLAPATLWYQPQSLTIAQTDPGVVPAVVMTRDIRFRFMGTYTVDVREIETNRLACRGSGRHNYKPATGDFATDLQDFAGDDPKCSSLPHGVFYAEACWTVEQPLWGILPSKTTCIISNPFRVSQEESE